MMTSLALGQPTMNSIKSVVIKVIQGPDKGDTYRIQPPGAVVGRDPQSCQIVLKDHRVSRQQCRIDFKFNGIFIEDLTGKNTTFVNLQSVTTQILASGDQLGFGDTIFEISFENQNEMTLAGSGKTAPFALYPGFKHQTPIGSIQTSGESSFLNKKNIVRLGFGVILLALVYVLNEKPVVKKPSEIAAPDHNNQAIEAVQKRQEELRKPLENLTQQDLYNKRSAEKYFFKGFRDFQNKSYSRAIESFQTALAVQPKYIEAKRYLKLAEKQRQNLVDDHMSLGNKYKGKSMYQMCVAEFEKVLQIINRPEDKKYQLAKEQIQECRLLKKGIE